MTSLLVHSSYLWLQSMRGTCNWTALQPQGAGTSPLPLWQDGLSLYPVCALSPRQPASLPPANTPTEQPNSGSWQNREYKGVKRGHLPSLWLQEPPLMHSGPLLTRAEGGAGCSWSWRQHSNLELSSLPISTHCTGKPHFPTPCLEQPFFLFLFSFLPLQHWGLNQHFGHVRQAF